MELDEKPNAEDSSSSVAVEEVPPPATPVEELTDTQRTKWLESGDLPKLDAKEEEKSQAPVEKELDEKEESSPSKEVAEKAEPAPAKIQEKAEIPPSEARIKDLVAKNKILEQRLARLEQPVEKTRETEDEAPKAEDYEDIEKYVNAKVEYEVSQGIKKAREAQEAEENKSKIETKNKEIVEKWNQSVTDAKKKYSDFEEKCFGEGFNIVEGSVLDRWCLESELGTDVLYHYATHPEEFAKLNQIANPVQAAREIARLEVKILEKPKPVAKLVSDAPKPPSEVSGRGTATDDPIAAALASGDMEKYMDLMNKKERAERSGK